MTTDPPIRIVPAAIIQELFNAGHYWERALVGEFVQDVRRSKHPCAPAAHQPFCTRSQIVYYRDAAGKRIAVVHQYLRVDGRLGASGRPDPKRLVDQGIEYVAGHVLTGEDSAERQ